VQSGRHLTRHISDRCVARRELKFIDKNRHALKSARAVLSYAGPLDDAVATSGIAGQATQQHSGKPVQHLRASTPDGASVWSAGVRDYVSLGRV